MLSKLGAMRLTDPATFNEKIRSAMARAKGRIPDAADALGVSARQLRRWLDSPELRATPRVPNGARR